MMTFLEFKSSLKHAEPPQELSALLKALWHDGKGNWDASHNIAQDIHTKEGSLVHAYLHRKEGDAGNAAYWYQKANRAMPKVSLELEWEEIVREFLP
jgi:hypothetical protein